MAKKHEMQRDRHFVLNREDVLAGRRIARDSAEFIRRGAQNFSINSSPEIHQIISDFLAGVHSTMRTLFRALEFFLERSNGDSGYVLSSANTLRERLDPFFTELTKGLQQDPSWRVHPVGFHLTLLRIQLANLLRYNLESCGIPVETGLRACMPIIDRYLNELYRVL